MSLTALYKQFLAAPNSSQLADDASLHYITTTTSFRGATDIMKHNSTTRNQLKTKKQDFLSAIEGANAIAVEVDTTLEFLTSGGAYLPALDDNFLADRTVYIPITHLVTFDGEGKVLQIRQTWDQASLLKQLDIIGKSGRNWPIRDSKEQIKMIENCIKSSTAVAATQDANDVAIRSRVNANNIMRDPHASLALFAPRDESDQSIEAVISPRGGARPRQRDFTEILGDEPVDDPASPSAGREPSESPNRAVAHKGGVSKKFQPSRLFETDEDEESKFPEETRAPNNGYRPNPNKYNHFDFADGSDPQDAPRAGDPTPQKTKHSSQWSFDDFVTPAKGKPGKVVRKQEERHWGTEDDEVQETPVRKPVQGKARRDAEHHFDFIDDGTPKGEPRVSRPRGATQNNGLGLYRNNVYDEDEDETASTEEPRALGTITNSKDRGRDFDAHWAMTDEPSAHKPQAKAPIGDDRKKAVKMMDANWSSYDKSPGQENKPTAPQKGSKTGNDRGIAIAGDGMGGSKNSNRDWLFGPGDDDDSQTTRAVPGRKQGAAVKSGGFNWDF